MGAYKYINETMQNEYATRNDLYRKRLIEWRKSGATERVEQPTNLARARSLGYKAKKGYVLVRVKVKRGSRKRPKTSGGRKAKAYYMFKQTGLSHQVIAEQKAAHAYHNLEVLNSYWVGDDGNTSYFEIILADPMILDLSTLARKGRAFRGLTASGQKGRPSKKVIPNKARRRKMHLKKLAHEHGRRAASENAQ